MNEPRSEGEDRLGRTALPPPRTLEICNAPARLNTGSTEFIRCGRPPSDLHLVPSAPSSSYATLQSVTAKRYGPCSVAETKTGEGCRKIEQKEEQLEPAVIKTTEDD